MDERDIYRAKEAMQSAMKKGPMRVAADYWSNSGVFPVFKSMGSDWGR